jgi:DNA invertase Pin-like site-specific DNA recombinase
MKNAIELIRVSTEQQAGEDRAGIPAQREANRRTALVYGLTIVKTIEIVDVSGASVLKSPEMQELLRLMESSEIHGVVAKEFSRLMRPENFADFALLQAFVDSNTILYLPEGPIDFSSKTGRLMGTIRAAMAGMERREIVERMMDAKESMRRAGKHAGGANHLPFGVGYSDEKGWFYTADAEKVREAFRIFLSGETSYERIGERLNIPRTSVRFILENPIYTGWRVYDEKRDPSPTAYVPRPDGRQGYRKKMKRSADEVIRVRVMSDALVSDEDFARVQQTVELKRLKHWRSYEDKPARYTYNGFLACGDCGSLVYTFSSKYDFYHCKSSHPRERRKRALVGLEQCTNRYMLRTKLEPKLNFLIGDKLCEPDFLERVVETYNESLLKDSPSSQGPQVLTAKINQLQEKRSRVLDSFFEGLISKDECGPRIDAIDHDLDVFRNLLADSAQKQLPRSTDQIRAALEPLAEWEFLEREDKRTLLANLCPEISVFRYKIKAVSLNLAALSAGCDEVNLPPAAAATPPARCAEAPGVRPGTKHRCVPAKPRPAAAWRRRR